MEPELATLAASGATTLVGLMASDAWSAIKSRVGALLRRGQLDDAGSIETDLDRSHTELSLAQSEGDDSGISDIEAEWRMRLRRMLQQNPAAAGALRELIAEVAPPTGNTSTVHNTISGGDIRGPVIQTGTIQGDLRFD